MGLVIEDQFLKEYLFTFLGKDNKQYGFRFGAPKDAKGIIKIFENVYGYNYLYPYVYDVKLLEKSLTSEKKSWFIVKSIDNDKIVALSLLDLWKDYSVYAGKFAFLNEYRGLGIAQTMNTKSAFAFFSLHRDKEILRVDGDARAENIKPQQLAKDLNLIGYGFIPNYNNYGDKRNYKPSIENPFSSGRMESVIMYCRPLKNFWKKRLKNIFLLNNEDILFFYEHIKSTERKMKKDNMTIHSKCKFISEEYTIKEDFYKSILLIEGYLHEKTLIKLLKKYSNWNVIEWRIPTSKKGLYSQKIGLKHNFKIVGYDPGSHLKNNLLRDTLVYCNFPNGIDFKQFENLHLLKKHEELVYKVIDSIKKFKNKQPILKNEKFKLI
ncbi:MAG: hypothetical protein ACFFAO_04930 [Candidatus Hermodarchaeota archaeon]